LTTEPETRGRILAAAKEALLDIGFAQLSTRKIAEVAGVPLSQIHYHFGSKQNLMLEVLAEENRKLLERQTLMYQSDMPLWKQWEQACDFLEDDLRSGYVRVLHEMVAAGWSDQEIAVAVRDNLRGWFDLLNTVAESAEESLGGLGPFTARETAALVGLPFLGAETAILLGIGESVIPARAALRKVGAVIRALEEGADT
jgi:AcrR family transcriptional regulator